MEASGSMRPGSHPCPSRPRLTPLSSDVRLSNTQALFITSCLSTGMGPTVALLRHHGLKLIHCATTTNWTTSGRLPQMARWQTYLKDSQELQFVTSKWSLSW